MKGDAFGQNRWRGFITVYGIVEQNCRQLSPIHGLCNVGCDVAWNAPFYERLGFEVVGRLPGAFDHPAHGFVDALVLYRTL